MNQKTKKLLALLAVLALLAALAFLAPSLLPDAELSASSGASSTAPTPTQSVPRPTQSQSVPDATQSTPATDAPSSQPAPTAPAPTEPAPTAPKPTTPIPTTPAPTEPAPTSEPTESVPALDADVFYYSKEDVALYIHLYGRLPGNFVTKSQANKDFGSSYKAMQKGYRIGGDRFGNREGLLPAKPGRTWTECDIVAPGGTSRGAERIVFSSDGLVYYTGDHYASFTLLYGEP